MTYERDTNACKRIPRSSSTLYTVKYDVSTFLREDKLNGRMRNPRVVFIGPPSVGKTSLVNKIVQGAMGTTQPTTGNVYSQLETHNPKHPKLEMWDTAGMERFRAVNTAFYREANGAFFVFDLCNFHSFEGLDEWYNNFTSSAQVGVPIILIANKCERDEGDIEVTDNEIQAWANDKGITWMKTSAATGENVKEMIERMIDLIPEMEHVETTPLLPDDNGKKCC